MRERIVQGKKITASVSIPTLKQPIRGFGLESLNASPSAAATQPIHKPLGHDISRIAWHRPQAKLTIGQPGDFYEQQADSVAQQVMQRIAQSGNRQSIQRQEVPEEEEQLQMKPLEINTLQRQEMPEEEEQLQMKSLEINTLQRQEVPEEEEQLQMKPDSSTLQRQEVPQEEEQLQMKPMVQRQGGGGMAATSDLETSINQARGGGQPLADDIREPMEQAFGADFSGVKVHTDTQSDQLNRSIQARAFTTGQDVFFRQGEYNPGSRGGQELLAHELTHVVQQNGGAVKTTLQRTYDKQKLETTISEVYTNIGKNATEKDFVAALKKFVTDSAQSSEEIFKDPDFAWHLMKLVGEESGMRLHEKIKESSEHKGKPILYKNTPVFQANWTLRTYTTSKDEDGKPVIPSYKDLKPTAELLVSGIKDKSDNTNDADWNKIGNVGFTFHLLCIDGNVPQRKFLSSCTHYAEFSLDSIPNLFVSGDMLGTTGNSTEEKPGGFKGSGADVKAALCSLTLDRSNAGKFLKGLDEMFGNFEIKVPGQLKVTEWKAK
jgi:hypothetical protein